MPTAFASYLDSESLPVDEHRLVHDVGEVLRVALRWGKARIKSRNRLHISEIILSMVRAFTAEFLQICGLVKTYCWSTKL